LVLQLLLLFLFVILSAAKDLLFAKARPPSVAPLLLSFLFVIPEGNLRLKPQAAILSVAG
jgi:hypothetical protein